jgi:hypothetical protein
MSQFRTPPAVNAEAKSRHFAVDFHLASFCRKRQNSAAESAFSAVFGGKFCLPVGGAMSLI